MKGESSIKLLAGECQRQTYMKETYHSHTETLEQS